MATPATAATASNPPATTNVSRTQDTSTAATPPVLGESLTASTPMGVLRGDPRAGGPGREAPQTGSTAEEQSQEQAAIRVGVTSLEEERRRAKLAEEWGRTAVVEEGLTERIARLYHMLTDMRLGTEG